jgi:hypothetical protein
VDWVRRIQTLHHTREGREREGEVADCVRPDPTTQEKAESEKVRYEDWVRRVQTPTTHKEKAESEKVRYGGLQSPYHTQMKRRTKNAQRQ